MINVHEVFSTSITLDEVERANQEFEQTSSDPSDKAVRLCHASTLLPLQHERFGHAFIPFSPMLCAFYAGSDQDKGDTSIYVVRIEADGSHSSVQKLACPQLNQHSHSTPVMFYLNQGESMRARRRSEGGHLIDTAAGKAPTVADTLIAEAQKLYPSMDIKGTDDSIIALVYKAGKADSATVSYLSMSFNDGRHFITPREMVPDTAVKGRGPVRTKPYLVRKGPYAGRVIMPCSVDSNEGLAFVDYSDDDLRTLHQSNEITPSTELKEASAKAVFANGVVQAALFEDLGNHATEDNDLSSLGKEELEQKLSRVHMIMSARGSQVYVADSEDAGSTFSEPYAVPLYNNLAGIDCVTYMNRLLVCGKLVTDKDKCDPEAGAPLAIYVSSDGRSFTELLRLEDEPKGVFTSPYMQVDRRHHLLYVCYTDHRKAIKIRIFRLLKS
ncbi:MULTISPECIES: exo-alpha-sialidase [unclassified Anaerobiospirillum]|uniref:exo-alpha-sialidase n=1 Tax=unclassified Anaerobiospirillum TaxID=2647410 RepID=UPI001FF25DB2|nr:MULTISPECIES: exo-alpha-sialidase [unclassified Anaerobiospirillum]MCK0533994.1 exo-alpha-sialidase [Anaerobiospirillum sp. NML120511]MCK0539263.1 exo-alpha-sialidase [Anaerobiospirillum sp. NML02-A-032]